MRNVMPIPFIDPDSLLPPSLRTMMRLQSSIERLTSPVDRILAPLERLTSPVDRILAPVRHIERLTGAAHVAVSSAMAASTVHRSIALGQLFERIHASLAPAFVHFAWLDRFAKQLEARGPEWKAYLAIDRNEYMKVVTFTTDTLGLGPEHVEHVIAVLMAEAWQDAADPIEHIKAGARRRYYRHEALFSVRFRNAKRVRGDLHVVIDRESSRDSHEHVLAWLDFQQLSADAQQFCVLRTEGYTLEEIQAELAWNARKVERVRKQLERRGLSLPTRTHRKPS